MEGKFEISITDKKTLTSTRAHDLHDLSLCWDYAAASLIRISLRIKSSQKLVFKYLTNFFKASLLKSDGKDETLKLFGQGYHHKILNGLNSLQSIKHICSLLSDPNIFKNFYAKSETLVPFVRKRKFFKTKTTFQVYLVNN